MVPGCWFLGRQDWFVVPGSQFLGGTGLSTMKQELWTEGLCLSAIG
jgi:hypothetical protein